MFPATILVLVVLSVGVGCDRSASERPTERNAAERADSAAAPPASAGAVSSNDKITDAGAASP